MNITLYKYTGERDNATKINYLTNPLELNGTLREESSAIQPSITFKASFNPQNYNYAYIEEFKRYYFITNITYIRNELVRLDFNVDVLYTFWNKATIEGVVERNENEYNEFINDGIVKFSDEQDVTIYDGDKIILDKSSDNFNNLVLTLVNGVTE